MRHNIAMPREVIFEIKRIGNMLRVAAFDSASLTEAVVAGPASANVEQLKQAALRKLDYILSRRSEKT